MRLLRVLLAATAGLVAYPASLLAAEVNVVTDSAASALSEGFLPNGLRYLILPHTAPRGGISLQLVVAAGSIDEHDDERGFAHFVEHMAFNGTRHHPPGTLEEFFQRLGLTPGADLNAATNFTATVYKLDLPANRTDQLDRSLQLLRDYADGISFLPAEVESEKGIVLSEFRARDGAATRVRNETLRVVYAGTPFVERDVIGLPAQIQGATAETLRKFYQRCYRPERMTVIVTGQVNADKVAEKLSAAFSSLVGVGPTPAAIPLHLPRRAENLEANFIVNPTGTAASISLGVVVPRAADAPEARREEWVQRIATSALQRRLQERRERNLDRFGPASASFSPGISGRFIHHSVEVQTAVSRWQTAVEFAESELRRARVQGFDEAEVQEAATVLLTQLRNRAQSFRSVSTQQLAQEIAFAVVGQRSWRHPAHELADAEQDLATLSSEEVTRSIDTMFPEQQLRVIVTAPKIIENGPLLAVAAYKKSAEQPLPTPDHGADDLHFGYRDFGVPGKVASETFEADLGLSLVTFSNGTRLNLRPSKLQPQRFILRATLGRGIFDVEKNRSGLGHLGTSIITLADLGRHTRGQIGRLLALHGISARFDLTDNVCSINFSGPSAELPFSLQLLTAFLSDLKLDPAHQRTVYSQYSANRRFALSTPTGLARITAVAQLGANDRRLSATPVETVMKYKLTEVFDWMREHWLQGPLEIGIVGDFQRDEVVTATAASVGTLPTRGALRPTTSGEPLTFTTKSGTQLLSVKLPAGAATAFLTWPAMLPDAPVNNRSLQFAADVLRDRLRLKLREELGATYSPAASVSRYQKQRDYAYLWAELTFEPKQAKILTERVIALADELARNGITSEEFERLKEPRRTRNAEQMRDNGWWLAAIVASAQSQPSVLEEARGHLTGYDSITAENVNRAARAFSADSVVAVVAVPTPTANP